MSETHLTSRPSWCWGSAIRSHSFTLAILLHLLAVSLLLLAASHWPIARVISGPVSVQLDVTELPPAPVSPVEPPVLDRALAAIPNELRAQPAMAAAVVPDVRSAIIPEPRVAMPDGTAEWRPPPVTMREPTVLAGSVMPEPSLVRSVATSGIGTVAGGRPVALSEIMPHYPYGARARGEAGRVTLHVRVTGQGVVEAAEVASGSGYPALDDSAVAATERARFKPAEKDGKPVPATMTLQFDFRLEDRL